jgi:hypothetical protein
MEAHKMDALTYGSYRIYANTFILKTILSKGRQSGSPPFHCSEKVSFGSTYPLLSV